MVNESNPLVSIGVPVFNGEKGLAVALDSLIAQDYPNLEIIISDNGSTDSTPKICAEYVRKDHRFRYHRSEKNRGTTWNFNRVFELSSGKYFMYAAHDDTREQFFVSECLSKMEQYPEAAVCHPQVAMFIEGHDKTLCIAHLDSFEGLTGLVDRYRENLKHVTSTAMYGLFRSSAMRKTGMHQRVIASDIVFLQELSIYGIFIQVRKTLFNFMRREKWNTIDQDYFVFFGKKEKPWWYLPFVVVFCRNWKQLAGSTLPFGTKLRLWCVLLEHEIRQTAFKVFIRLAGWFCPDNWKERIGCAIYWRWMDHPNLQVENAELFLERVIKVRLGWWK